MANDKTLIMSGSATLAIGDAGGAATAVGYTRGGVSVTKSKDTRRIEADQTYHPLYIQTSGEGFEINMRLLESTLENMKIAFGEVNDGSGGPPLTALSLGVFSTTPEEKIIELYGTRKDGEYVKFTFYRCILTATGAYSYSKDDEALLEATFTAVMDDTENCLGLAEITSSP